MKLRTHLSTGMLLVSTSLFAACGGRHDRVTTASGGDTYTPSTATTPAAAPATATAPADTTAPEHHSKLKGALVGAAAGEVLGGHKGALAGAAAGALVQHHRNKAYDRTHH